VTLPPSDRPLPDTSGAYPAASSWAPAEPPARAHRSRRGLVVATALAGTLVLGGTGYAVASYLSGSGTQPEDVLPTDTLGFVKLDLDPSAAQKMALGSLLQKFPSLETGADGDLRGQLLDPLLDEAGTGLSFAADVQPWLGARMAVAVVPAEEAEAGVVPVAALAVTDDVRMTEALTRAQQGADFGFALRDDYVLITDTQERAESIAAAEETLSDDADFAGDRDALGGDQIALAWADLSAAQGVLAAAVPAGALGAQELSGRVILGVHAEDDAVEMVGLDFGVSDFGVPRSEPTRLAHGLPRDTLAALSVSGAGDAAVAAWEEMAQSGALAQVEEPLSAVGLELPEDLRTILGTDLAVALLGDLGNPAFGARVTTEQPQEAVRLLDRVLSSPEFAVPVIYSDADGGYVVASDQATLDALAADGGLADTPAFRAAVADRDDASAIGYVNLAAVVDQLVAQGGDHGEEAAKFSAVEALGFSATGTDEGSRFVLRITTR
jgi:hypothetical protein